MDHLAGRGRTWPFAAVLTLVGILAVLAGVRLVPGGTGPRATAPPPAAPVPASSAGPSTPADGGAVLEGSATSVRLPTQDCRAASALELAGLGVTPHAASQPADPLADLEVSACGAGGGVVVTPHGDALLSPSGIAADADYAACAEAMREGTVSELPVGPGTTFCALQRADTSARSRGQTSARLTVTAIDGRGVTVYVVRWRV